MDILSKIIEHDGDCSKFADREVCKVCPLSKLRKKDNGNYYSCIEAVWGDRVPSDKINAVYKETAEQLLVDRAIDDILREDIADDKRK